MKIRKFILVTAIAASGILTGGSFVPVRADSLNTGVSYLENFNNFGSQGQILCKALNPEGKGNCAADSAINSFVFLEKQYPNIYGNSLTPHYESATNTDQTDTLNFAYNGWPEGNPTYQGYYARSGDGIVNYVNTAQDWINYYSPDTTVVTSWFNGGLLGYFTKVPTFNEVPTLSDLEQPLKNNDAVQLGIYNSGGDGHEINLTGVSCDLSSNCNVYFQDPNDPTHQQMSKLTSGGVNNGFQITVPSLNSTPFSILAETSFSPVLKSEKKVDLAFVIDTTGSTQPYIAAIQNTTQSILNTLNASGSNYRIAVVDYKDFPQGPGEPGDYVYKADLPFTTDTKTAGDAIDNLANIVGGGGDIPEAAYSALIDTINAQGLGTWRNNASKDIVIISDAPPHDPEPYTGYTANDVISAAFNADPISIYSIIPGINNNSYTASAYNYFSKISTESGGEFFPAATYSDIDNALLDIVNHIVTTSSSPVVSVPEPSSIAGILVFGAFGAYYRRKRQRVSE